MERITQEKRVPKFNRRKNGDGYCDRNGNRLLDGLFGVTIYPDGDEPENEGYVSIVLEYGNVSLAGTYRFSLSSYQFTVSVVDTSGESRFPQSFQIDVGGESWMVHPIRLERLIRRRVLLDSRKEFLPEDTLTLRFDVACFLKDNLLEENDDLKRVDEISEEESWFVHGEKSDFACYYRLDLRNPDSPLCTRLREKSEFFEALFLTRSKQEDGFVPIRDFEFGAFFDMLCYVRFGNLRHVQLEKQYCDLYKIADKYGVVELQEICSAYLKQHLTFALAMHVLCDAHLSDDADLRTAAFRVALEHWTDKRNFYGVTWYEWSWNPTMAMRELKCALKILNLEDQTCDTLCDLAARRVLLDREQLQLSPTWKIFASEMPDLAKVISSWDPDEYKPAEKYKEHARSYDFYR